MIKLDVKVYLSQLSNRSVFKSKMRAITVVLAGLLTMAAAASDRKVVCYFDSTAVNRPGNGKFDISYIDPTLCTHLIYAFVGITEDGNVRVLDDRQNLAANNGKDGFGQFNKLREISPETKTMISMGGSKVPSTTYSHVAGNPSIRKCFVENVIKFVKLHEFDGFDVNWMFPNQRGGVPADKDNYVALLRELREKFDQEGLILSVAVGADEKSASQSYIISEMSKYPHFISLMTDELQSISDKKTSTNAPLYAGSWEKTHDERSLNVNASIHYWLENGAPAEKLILGAPLYGLSFTLANPAENGIGAPTSQPSPTGPYTRIPGVISYNEICEKFVNENWHVEFQEEQRAAYAFSGDQWIGYNDERSLTEKTEFAKKMGLGGMMIWSVDFDDFKGICGEKYPLLKTINYVLHDGQPPLSTNP